MRNVKIQTSLYDKFFRLFYKQYQVLKKGDKFGRWTITGNIEIRKIGIKKRINRKYYECICQCGKITWIRKYALKNKKTRSCGCLKKKDLTGLKFGRLTVIEECGRSENRHILWLCKCICGKNKVIKSPSLIFGKTKSCGCLSKELTSERSIIDLTGQRFERLVVIKENGRTQGKQVLWLCKCDCGNETIIIGSSLKNGQTKSCGCYQKERTSKRKKKNILGQRFGHLIAIKESGIDNFGKISWLCKCDCGNETTVVGSSLRIGVTKSCGCLYKTGKTQLQSRKGYFWEDLVKKYVDLYRFKGYKQHKRLDNNKLPDLISDDNQIIIESKLHDYIRSIENDVENYQDHCKKLIFTCMERKRNDWQFDFYDSPKVEFWYPRDMLEWIPESEHERFLQEIEDIRNMKDLNSKNLLEIISYNLDVNISV